MKIILRQATIIDPKGSYHKKIVDLQIIDGIITKITDSIPAQDGFEEVTKLNLHVSVGWFDTSVCLGEPGYEERETIQNGLQVAASSGFTGVMLQPNTYPVIDNQSAISFVLSQSKSSVTSVFPIGALTKKSEGKDLAELFDMKKAGAVAFGDYNKAVANPMVLKIALQYAQDVQARVIAFSEDRDIRGHGVVREGKVSTYLGLKGIPALAEELHIARNLFLLAYTGGKLHIPTISTAASVQLIREAKAKGLDVTCSVSAHHLVLTESVLKEFDTRYKVLPPLGSEADKQALMNGVLNGTIDAITSDHNPIDIEFKKMEFDTAKFGTIGLESAYVTLQTILPTDVIIEKLTAGRLLFDVVQPQIKEGAIANLTLFSPAGTALFTKEKIQSKSKNSAFLGSETKGQVYGVINYQKIKLNK